MIHCHISFPNPLTHLIHVELRFDNIQGNELDLILPYWRPGKYEKACFSKNISLLFANDDFETDVAKQLQNVKLICKAFYCAVFKALKSDNPKHAYKIHWSQHPTSCVRFPAHDGSYILLSTNEDETKYQDHQ